MTDTPPCKRALLSVSDKSGLVPFARRLAAAGVELVSTGGTARALREAGLDILSVDSVTDFPEVFGGRVKTLHPMVHGGLLFRRDNPDDVAAAADLGVTPIDLLVVNLYPFSETVARPDATEAECIEKIDIGGPAMVRAAAKNHAAVAVVVSPSDYDTVAASVEKSGAVEAPLRRRLAWHAFRHTAAYDAAIARWMDRTVGGSDALPHAIHDAAEQHEVLRYGENPHQEAALYTPAGKAPLGGARVLQGKPLSYNNLVDCDAALQLAAEFDGPSVAVIKHTNPCGVGRHESSLADACARAIEGDPVSAFGGIVAANRPVDEETAHHLSELFLEVVAAPRFTDDAIQVLSRKKNLRLVELDPRKAGLAINRRDTLFGTLAQSVDSPVAAELDGWKVVTEAEPTAAQREALLFAMSICKHVKSNAIVLANDQRSVGVGAGQMSRVDSVELAVKKATGPTDGAVLASDAFFPFRDGLDAAAEAGIKAVIQPGGSRRDQEVIDAANEHGIAMVFTGYRHFRH